MHKTYLTPASSPSLHQGGKAKFSYIAFIFTTALLALYAILEGQHYLFGPAVLETGDFAANALQIIDASHFRDIYGNYSRWGFNHPGPFFFYLYSLGETLFLNALRVVKSPDQAHVLAGIIFQSLCFAWGACEFARLTRRLSLVGFLVVAAIVLPYSGAALSSIWPPHVLLAPYFALLVSCVSLSLGYRSSLSIAVLLTCILCHGHVAQPLMTIPILTTALVAYARYVRRSKIPVSQSAVQIALSSLIIIAFLLPLAIDLTRCPDCNAHRILSYLYNPGETRPNWHQAINYVASYFSFDHHPEWISSHPEVALLNKHTAIALLFCSIALLLPYTLRRWITKEQFQALRTTGLFLVIAIVLSLIWAKRITGPLYEFNAFFIYSLVLMAWLLIISTISMCISQKRAPGFVLVAMIALTAILYRAPENHIFSANDALKDTQLIPDHPNELAVVVQDDHEDWPTTATFALWLARHDIPFLVPKEWAFLFGWRYSLDVEKILESTRPIRIWRTTNPYKDFAGKSFDLTRSCRIDEHSPEIEGSLPPSEIDAARHSCALNTVGISSFKGQPWIWTEGNLVIFQFDGHHTEHPVHISFDVSPYLVNGKLDKQAFILYVNQQKVASLNLSEARLLSFEVNPSIWNRSKVVTLLWSLPNATSPAELGLSIDSRKLGFRFQGMSVDYGDTKAR